LVIAHKSVAHLTTAPVDLESLPQLADCGLVTLRLIERHVYAGLKLAVPDYRAGWPELAKPPDQTK
jgi:hypothetical protein